MKKLLSAKYSLVLFILFFTVLCFFYRYDKIFTYRPTSIHQHRQCDCLSFTYNYYKCGNDFFKPQINYKTGKNFEGKATAEFPIIYFIVAQLWKVFGYHEWIYRLFVVLIMFLGLLALFKVFQYILNEPFWQIILPLWLFSSPILIYYGNNFLTDVPGLSFAFIGWYFFIRYLHNYKLINLICVLAFFCLAMLIKITSGISFLILLSLFILEWTKIKQFEKPLFKKPLVTFFLFILVCTIVLTWYIYAINYNEIHFGPTDSKLFQTGLLPIWDLEFAKIILTFRILLDYQFGNYFNILGLFTIMTFFIIVILNYKKQDSRLIIINIFIFITCISGMSLWFQAYNDHDYHLINYLIFIPATCLTFFKYLKTDYPGLFRSLKLKIPMLVIVLICIYWGHVKIGARYADGNNPDYQYSALLSRREVDAYKYHHWIYPIERKAFETITPYLRSIGISEKDPVFTFPDPTPNVTLYLMGQWGVPVPRDNGVELLKYLDYYKGIEIKYFILSDTTLLNDSIINNVLSNKIGQYQNISVYDIRKNP